MKLIKEIDIFGKSLKFNIRGQTELKSLTGVAFTLVLKLLAVWFSVLSETMITKESWSLFIINFVVEKKITEIYRRFMKIKDLAAQIGGIISAIYKVMLFVNMFFYDYLKDDIMLNSFFSFENLPAEKLNSSSLNIIEM